MTCPRCGAEIGTDSAVCPTCLMKLGLVGDEETALSPDQAEDGTFNTGPRLMPGQRFGPYRIERLLGRGGMGEAYEAEHPEQGRRVALKVLNQALADEKDRARFLREGQLAASVNHPNTVYIFGAEEIEGTPVIVMELVAAGTLKDKVKAHGPLPPADAVDAILQIIAGLDAAHAAGILHRDIKPSNCFVDHDGTVKVGDFGLSISSMARDVTQLTTTGSFQGTPQFASPEQLKGEPLDVRSDIYSVGATLYYLLTANAPFEADDLMALVARITTEAPTSARDLQPSVPKALAAVVRRCLAKDPAARPATYATLHDALLLYSSSESMPAPTALRVGAALVDGLGFPVAVLGLLAVASISRVQLPILDPELLGTTAPVFWITYWSLAEGFGGVGLGKGQFGLRVVATKGGRAEFPRVVLRSLLAFSPVWLLTAVRAIAPSSLWLASPVVALAIWFVVLFASARRANGFAGLHELLSGTRTVKHGPRLVHVESDHPPVESSGRLPRQLGPYEIVEPIGVTADGHMFLAWDSRLHRAVWVHELSPAAVGRAADTRLERPRQLRWLGGQLTTNPPWDAYEALEGTALVNLLEPKPWRTVCAWLLDLSREFDSGTTQGPLFLGSIEDVWVTPGRGAKWLTFGAPAVRASSGVKKTLTAEFAQRLLYDVARRALGSRDDIPLPLAASAFLAKLQRAAFESVRDVVNVLTELSGRGDRVSSNQRNAALAACFVLTYLGSEGLSRGLMASALPGWPHPALTALAAVLIAGLGLVWALAWRGGFWLRLFRMAVVTADGQEVSRWRAVARAAVVWSWAPAWLWVQMSDASSIPIAPVTLAAVIFASLDPVRGVQDRIAGTWLVPR